MESYHQHVHFDVTGHVSGSPFLYLFFFISFSDVDIHVGKETFRAHRLVLAACSSYFCGMFTGGMSEATEGAVELRQVEADVFRSLLGFVYTGKITCNV